MSNPTLRTLAKMLGLSRTTVSDALRGSPRVRADTIERVKAAAESVGYHRNPLTGTVMSLLRRSSGQEFRGVIGAIEIVPPNRTIHASHYTEALMSGINRRAADLGFKVEKFDIGPQGMTMRRLDTILQARGIKALVLLPAMGFPDFSALDWTRFTAVYTDYFIDQPPLHCVCSDHYRSMVALLQELHRRGYRRPGLFMDVPLDERLQYRWEGAFMALQSYLPGVETVPPLRVRETTRGAFMAWFNKNRPDVVIGHEAEGLKWLRAAGHRVPEDVGFVCLNSLRATPDCAALDFQADQLGYRAAELVTAQLLHNEMGGSTQPSLTTIPAKWVEGKTLLATKPVPAALPTKSEKGPKVSKRAPGKTPAKKKPRAA